MLDVDLSMGAPGSEIDDGFALALALADPDLSVELVTTVNGNTDVGTATVLTAELLHQLDRPDVPLHRGAARPLVRPPHAPGEVPDDVPHREPRPGAAAVAMVERAAASPGELTLAAVGPLTNVALALRLDPDFATNLKQLVIMGGTFNAPTHSVGMPGEFNLWSDPEAVAVVLASDVVARWVGLDVTLQVRLTRREAEEMAASEHPFVRFAGRYSAAWIDLLEGGGGRADDDASCALHDPLAVAAVSRPDLLTWREAEVLVETGDRFRGAVLADYDTGSDFVPDGSRRPRRANAVVAQTVRAEEFGRWFRQMLQQAPTSG